MDADLIDCDFFLGIRIFLFHLGKSCSLLPHYFQLPCVNHVRSASSVLSTAAPPDTVHNCIRSVAAMQLMSVDVFHFPVQIAVRAKEIEPPPSQIRMRPIDELSYSLSLVAHKSHFSSMIIVPSIFVAVCKFSTSV